MSDTPHRPVSGSGPKIVALGGGHGLYATLSAARLLSSDVTAVVTVADDGVGGAEWAHIALPAQRPVYALGFENWWYDVNKAAKLPAERR